MDSFQLGLKGILKRGADCYRLIPVGTVQIIVVRIVNKICDLVVEIIQVVGLPRRAPDGPAA